MQRRHYRTIARIISGLPSSCRRLVADYFGKELRGTNPRFDRERFYRACTPPEPEPDDAQADLDRRERALTLSAGF